MKSRDCANSQIAQNACTRSIGRFVCYCMLTEYLQAQECTADSTTMVLPWVS